MIKCNWCRCSTWLKRYQNRDLWIHKTIRKGCVRIWNSCEFNSCHIYRQTTTIKTVKLKFLLIFQIFPWMVWSLTQKRFWKDPVVIVQRLTRQFKEQRKSSSRAAVKFTTWFRRKCRCWNLNHRKGFKEFPNLTVLLFKGCRTEFEPYKT